MKRLFILITFCLPAYLVAQGFGSFSHDQPFLAGDAPVVSGNTAPPYTNLFIWYKADVGAYTDLAMTTSASNGATVLAWTNSINVTNQGYALNGADSWPKYYTNQVNGLPALIFGAASQHSGIVPAGLLSVTNIPQPFQVFIVFNPTNAASGVLWGDRAANKWNLAIANPQSYWFNDGGNFFYYATEDRNRWRIITCQANNTQSLVRTNGVLAASGTMGTIDLQGITIGEVFPSGSDAYKGWVAEFLFYVPTLSSNDTFRVEQYLSKKYQITNSVLTGL